MIDTVKARFHESIQKTSSEECWIWTGGRNSKGYGQIYVSEMKHQVGAHRLSWMLYMGPIPNGMYICHRCDNPSCVNPSHLFLGTHSDNMLDAVTKGRKVGWHLRQTHCKQGHPLTEDNLYYREHGYRLCKTCTGVYQKRYKQKLKGKN